MPRNTFAPGQHNTISDRTGRKFKSGSMREEWQSSLVHESEFIPKHPQIDLRGRPDDISVENPRPRQPVRFIDAPS